MSFAPRKLVALIGALSLGLWACGDSDADTEASASADRPTVVVTTNILGDVVENLVGDAADVVVIMPVGADPHDFQASAQQVAQMGEADALIVNGADFEEGLLDVISSATSDGVPTFEAISAVSTIEFGEGGHDDHGDEEDHDDDDHGDEDKDEEHSDEEGEEHSDEEHSDEEHSDEEGEEHSDEEGEEHSDEEHDDHDEEGHDDHEGHGHSGGDPHFFTDPARMAVAAQGIADFLAATLTGVDQDALAASSAAYIGELTALDSEAASALDAIPAADRILVTNHEVFGYFAERYGFEVVGTIIPSGSTLDGASAGALADLADLVEREGVPAIFSDTSASDELAQTLAGEVGDVAVVELFTESLGDADSGGATYLDMVRANVDRIVGALGG